MTGRIDILYFAWVREHIGSGGETIDHPGEAVLVSDLVALLAARGGGYAEALADPTRLRAALDQKFVPIDTPVGMARELAIFPPVTGG
ncbi:MAG: MoaD/ThiS family protein [Alphaproteobacteria bacterium]|nr:MoaD/ThiS family protein [Alphaproteobacteria bacterium]